VLLVALSGCGPLDLDPAEPVAWVVYDPGGGDIPTPNDLARDAEAGRLALPIDEGMSAAERALRTALNQQDAWSTVSTPSFALSAPVDPATVTPETVAVWEWTLAPAPVPGLAPEVADDGLSVTVPAPAGGWAPGGRYVVVVGGLATVDGVPIGPAPAFTFLRSPEPLTGHQRAFPGGDRAEREAVAARLEEIRADLAPTFDELGALGVPRDEIAALWAFSVTRRPELAMHAESQRMPLPVDLLIDRATGYVSLPPSDDDDDLEADAKLVANTLRGFSVSGGLTFEATHALDPDTVTDATIELWDLSATPVRVPADVASFRDEGRCASGDDGCVYVVVDPRPEGAGAVPLPLSPATTYAVLVREGVTDPYGEPLAPMAVGQLLRVDAPIAVDGASTVPSVPDEDAARVEPVRAAVDLLLDSVGRDGVVTAWTFTTMDAAGPLRDTLAIPDALGYDATPTVSDRGPPNRLFGSDPLSDLFPGLLNPADVVYLPRVDGVAEVITGTLPSPVHLDPVTRRWREPPVLDDIAFLATLPAGVPADEPVPVVIFGHGLVTDRRFVLTISGELAQRGFAAIAIDLPYHGERIACVDTTLLAVPNFFPPALQGIIGATDPLLHVPGCASGDRATCSPTGECLGPDGLPEPFAAFPIVDVRPASGAAFLDVHDLPHIPDHFRQALVDLSAVRYSLQSADWEGVLGRAIRTDAFLYAGQSLGGILGADFAALEPTVVRAVLNVPGANMVDLFDQSTMFGPQMDAFVEERGIVAGTYEHERLLNVARWLIDSVDPHSVAHLFREEGSGEALIQIDRINASLGDIVIPNAATDVLAEVSGLPVIEYPSALHGDLVIPLIGDAMLRDLADFLAEGQP
jgi:hypothetical protein